MATYSNAQLILILQKAARRINRILGLFGGTDEIVVDGAGDMTPDDGTLYDLVLLQAECMITQRGLQEDLTSSVAGVLAHDGEQTMDTRGVGEVHAKLLDSDVGACKQLQSQLNFEKLNRAQGRNIW